MKQRPPDSPSTILLQIETYRSQFDGQLFPVALIIRDSYGLSLSPPELFRIGDRVPTDAALRQAVSGLKTSVERWYTQPSMGSVNWQWLPDLDCTDEPPGPRQHALTMEQRRQGIHRCRRPQLAARCV